MQWIGPAKQPVVEEFQVLEEMLNFDGARVLELGCGGADKTRLIAQRTDVLEIIASEVDQIQHEKNLAQEPIPKVTFKDYGAEAIDEPDASFDIVLMFKSLHHVPGEHLDQAMREIGRVLKPGGVAYISEPVFAGAFNEVIRLFHDEELVRRAAFEAMGRAVNGGGLALKTERFFKNRIMLQHFGQFEAGIINATHTDHQISDALLEQVRERFEAHASSDGYVFEIENRVDLLERPAS